MIYLGDGNTKLVVNPKTTYFTAGARMLGLKKKILQKQEGLTTYFNSEVAGGIVQQQLSQEIYDTGYGASAYGQLQVQNSGLKGATGNDIAMLLNMEWGVAYLFKVGKSYNALNVGVFGHAYAPLGIRNTSPTGTTWYLGNRFVYGVIAGTSFAF